MKLQVVRVNQCYRVERWQDWMAKPLTGYKVEMQQEEEGDDKSSSQRRKPMKPVKVACKCYVTEPVSGEVLFYAGLLDDFIAEAKKNGYEVEAIDGRVPNPMSLVPNTDAIPDGLRYKQDEVLDKIIASDKGIINCNTGFGKSFLMNNLCLIYPTARIVIVTAARELVKQIYDGLVKLLGSAEVGLIRGGTPSTEESKRVLVSTCASILRCPLGTCDFLFFDEVHNIGFNKTFESLICNLGPSRCFGFTASPTRGDQALAAMKSLFGKVLASCTYQEATEHGMVTPMRAFMPRFTCEDIPVSADRTAAERANYWRNTARNSWIAAQASEAAKAFPEEQMLITVKTLEHALMLMKDKRLADWELIYSGSIPPAEKSTSVYTPDEAPEQIHAVDSRDGSIRVYDKVYMSGIFGYASGDVFVSALDARRFLTFVDSGLPVAKQVILPVKIAGIDVTPYRRTKKQVSEQVEAFARGDIKRAIATSMIKEGGNFYHLSHIFRADGSTSEVINTQFPGRASRVLVTKPEAIIVDPYDCWNDWVKGRSEARKKTYKKHGWYVEL